MNIQSTKTEKIENNNKKLFVTPILQADNCLDKSFDSKKEFKGVEEAFIISVTLDNINAVPNYYNDIHREIDEKKKCESVNYYFNFSIEEYEMLLYLIEQGIDIFSMLREYFSQGVLSPFSNYIRERVPDINMTRFMERNYKAASDEMKRILW